ncbi:MAG: hypothetical protein IKJ26_07090 [Clostridia bacterium]|nr:hypothetical protein [Clostridia bacterium]
MNKRERVLAVLDKKPVDHIPASFWFHFIRPEDAVGEGCVKAHLDYYRATDVDFIKIMSDGLGYPLKVTITCADDWFKVQPLPHDDPFYTESINRCRRINEELNGECCTFYNMFSPFNVVRERDVFTPECLAGRSWDETVMAHLKENEAALIHAMNVIGEDLAYLARMVITEGHCDGIYQSVQGAEKGRMSAEEYSRIVTPGEMKIINAANEVSNHNILHMCSWAGNPNHLSYWKDYPLCVKNWGCGVEGVSMAEGKELFEGAVLLGGMDNRRDHPLYAGTREEIQAAVADVLRQMDGTPFLMGADCTVPPDIDFDHIRWVLEALRA